MILKLYKGTGPGVILLVIITAAALWMGSLLDPSHPAIFIGKNPMPGWSWLIMFFEGRPVLALTTAFVVALITAFSLVWMNTWLFFINSRTYLPAVIYMLLISLFLTFQVLHPLSIGILFLLVAVKRIIDGYRKPGIGNNFFDSGLFIALGSLVYFNLIWFGVLIIIGIFLFRTFNAKDLFLTVMGLMTPYILLFSISFVFEGDIEGLWDIIRNNLSNEVGEYFWTRPVILASVFSGLLILLGLAHLYSMINTKKVRSRKVFNILTWIIVISIALWLLSPSAGMEVVLIGSLPAALIITHYFVTIRNRRLSALLFSIFFLLAVTVQIMRNSW